MPTIRPCDLCDSRPGRGVGRVRQQSGGWVGLRLTIKAVNGYFGHVVREQSHHERGRRLINVALNKDRPFLDPIEGP